MQGTKIDLLINCRWIIPVVPNNQILGNCALAIDAERIVGIYPQAEAAKCFDARKTEQLNDHIVMPGLVNAHGHAAMSLLRGYADDLPLRPWLENHIWPAESRHVSEEFVRDGTMLAMAEMISAVYSADETSIRTSLPGSHGHIWTGPLSSTWSAAAPARSNSRTQ